LTKRHASGTPFLEQCGVWSQFAVTRAAFLAGTARLVEWFQVFGVDLRGAFLPEFALFLFQQTIGPGTVKYQQCLLQSHASGSIALTNGTRFPNLLDFLERKSGQTLNKLNCAGQRNTFSEPARFP
jgi:hypothetical protein